MRASLSAVLALVCALFSFACGGGGLAGVHPGPMPSGGSFSGVWFSPQYGEMHIQQNGATAIGRFEKDEKKGRLQGTIDGDLMRFEWTQRRELVVGRPTESTGHGYFRVFMDPTENAWKIEGRWGRDDSESNGGPWTAIRARNRRPDLDGQGTTGGSQREESNDYSGTQSDGPDDLSDL